MKLSVIVAAALLFVGLPAGAASLPPTLLVNPLIGTSTTPDGSDVIDDFPGADVPWGMVQWSPDTPSQNAGGGYEYGDHEITGFSLTHLSGPGCNVFGDFSILPTAGAIVDPASAKQAFLHANETAAPGWYAVSSGDPAIHTELTVTQRTGLGAFTYPQTSQANVLFKVSSNQSGVRNSGFTVTGPDEVAGFADTGGFCGMPDRYSVYFVAKFDRPFAAFGTWSGKTLSPGSHAVDGAASGGWVSFDASQMTTVKVKIGLSFVDQAGARANLQAENTGWSLVRVRNDATAQWQQVLHRIAIEGGTLSEQRTFYTAFYHALLHPNIFSDANGLYRGFDGKVHHVRAGHVEYANFSDWDIYRTLVPLVALIAPHEASDMVQSLVDAAQQDVFLPRWALANGATSVMGGDSVDPLIAGAYAFGARDFDVHGALAAMEKGASDTTVAPADGWYVERPELPEYLQHGYIVNTHTTSVSPVPNGASETLEYALDDFSIAQFARNVGSMSSYQTYLQRSANWAKIFNTATGLIAPRDADGAFMNAPINSAGQSGFQEGTAAQYTWMVPQDLHDLVMGMGGRAATLARLDQFFSKLNAGEDQPYAWLGNEPTIGAPWVYLSAGAPWRAQSIVRQSVTTMYADTPTGLPGNDDLGTMSAWYVWSAIGLYPQNPSVRGFDIGSPLFRHVVVTAPNGPTIDIHAPNASDTTPYVDALSINGRPTQRTWVDLPLHGALRFDFALNASPNQTWGSAPEDAPPSYGSGNVSFAPSTTAVLDASKMHALNLAPGGSGSLGFSVSNEHGTQPAKVTWHVEAPSSIVAQPASGVLDIPAGSVTSSTIGLNARADAPLGLYNIPIIATAANGALLERQTLIVRVAHAGEVVPLAYLENRFDNTITPFDPRTSALGEAIPVGTEPRDGVFSRDGSRLFIPDRGDASVSVVDTATQSVLATVKVGNAPCGIALTPDGKQIWFANFADSTVQSIDTTTLKAGAAIAVGRSPRQVAIAPDGLTMYVTNEYSNSVTPIDLRTGTARPQIPVGHYPSGIAITPDGKTAYVVDSTSNDVTPIDLASGHTLPAIPVGVYPVLIAISPDGKVAYVTNFATTTVTPIDLATNTVRSPINVGGAPYGVAFAHDAKTAYVVLRRDNGFVPVDVASGRVGTPITLARGPYTIVVP